MNKEEKKLAEEMALRYSNYIMREPQIHWAKDMREANEKYKSLWTKLCGRIREVMVDAVQAELEKTLAGQGRAEDIAMWFDDCFPDEPIQDALWEAIPDSLECRLTVRNKEGLLPFNVEILPGHLILWPKTKKKKGVRKCQPK